MKGLKRLRRISPAVISLALSACLLSACGKDGQAYFESGFFRYTNSPAEIMIAVRSDKDTFSREDVTIDLFYGFHNTEYDEKYNYDPKDGYLAGDYKEVVLCLYFGHYIYGENELFTRGEFEDYKSVENHCFVKEISDGEAFSGEYGYTMTRREGVTYNHRETVTVPLECLIENEHGVGFIRIEFRAFCKPQTEGDRYLATAAGSLDLRYENVDDSTIKVSFTNKKYAKLS